MLLLAGLALGAPPEVDVLAFGSCAKEDEPQPIWEPILAAGPDVFAFLGDNVYADTREVDEIRAAYARLGAQPGYRALSAAVPVVATWDDHDYGENDAGADYPLKEASREIFLDFFGEPAESPRRRRDGVYTAYTWGPPGRRVQLLLLDTRYNRSALPTVDRVTALYLRQRGRGPYRRHLDPDATFLGEAQWAWLEERLREPAEVRLVASSIPVLSGRTGWETWANLPRERERLLRLLDETDAEGVVFLSGDTHLGELHRRTRGTPYPLWELTSSGLTESWSTASPNERRVGEPVLVPNFGLVRVDWEAGTLTLELRDEDGRTALEQVLDLATLSEAR